MDNNQSIDKNKPSGILVVAEHNSIEVSPGSLQLIGKGRELAGILSSNVKSVILGNNQDELNKFARILIEHGADEVFVINHEELKDYRTLPYTRNVAELIKNINPEIVLFSASTKGRDLAPRVAARIGAGLTADCTNLTIGDYEDKIKGQTYNNILYQIRPAFGGDVIATIVSPGYYPQMATVRRDVFDTPEPEPGREGVITNLEAKFQEEDMELFLEEVAHLSKKTVDLKKAKVIISAGRGISKDPDKGFALMEELAGLLGGIVAGSRGVVDRGWLDQSQQVGQTGQTVKPEVYIACGISGAIQHIAGMSGAKTVIAINNDASAPIFKNADYGIVGDLFEILPKMICKLKC
jgi:electron transfer flavoprotein alpha subunit